MNDDLTIAELVRNGSMSAAMAGTLWAAVDEGVSFITVAVPQNAGKSTTANAVLQLRPPGVLLHPVADEPERLEQLKRERLGGYLVVGEFSQDRKSTRLNSSHVSISYAVFCLKKK